MVTNILVNLLSLFSTLKMKTECFSGTSVTVYQIKRCHVPGDRASRDDLFADGGKVQKLVMNSEG